MTFLPRQELMVNIITTTMAVKKNVSLPAGAVQPVIFQNICKNTFWFNFFVSIFASVCSCQSQRYERDRLQG